MVGRLILRGLLCGLVAGLLTFGFARVLGEPLVDRAITFETAMDQAKGEAPEPEVVSRATQAGLGLFTATLVVGTALGGLFALAFALLHGRLGAAGARKTAALLAFAAFVVLAVVPMLKYPANPPSVGDPGTIGLRTALYFELIAVSLAAGALGTALARLCAAAWGAFDANLAGLALFVALVAAALWFMPAVDEVPEHFSAVLLWRFRMASLGMQAVIWAVIGLGFGALARPLLEKDRGLNAPVRAATVG
jgi:pimeloyl-ACP methyl ester carboxylesterase